MAQSSSKKADLIRDIYALHGGHMPPSHLTRFCIEAGLWSVEERNNRLFASLRRQCVNAIKGLGLNGMPLSGMAKNEFVGKERVWKQLDLWTYDDAMFNLAVMIRSGKKDQATIERLADYIKSTWENSARFNIPHLYYPDGEPEWWDQVLEEGRRKDEMDSGFTDEIDTDDDDC